MIDPTQTQPPNTLQTDLGPALPTGTVSGGASADWASLPEEEKYKDHNWVWDKLGRGLFGAQENAQADPGLLGGIPVVGDIARATGAIWRGITDAGGVAVNEAVVKLLAGLFRPTP